MVASLKFYTDSGKVTEATVDLSDAKVVVYEDGNDNKYTLDASSINDLTKIDDIKLSTLKDVVFKYQPKSGSETTTTGLGSIIGTLLSTQSAQDGKTILAEEVAKKPVVDTLIPELAKDDGTTGIYTKKGVDDELAKKADTSAIPAAPDLSNYLETSKLAEEVAKKPVVEAIFDLEDGGTKISETKIGTTFAKKTDLDNKANTVDVYTKADADTAFVKATDLGTKVAEKAVVEAIFDAKDGKQSILVNKLGEALDRVQDNADDKVYGAQGSEKIAKDFLADKGLKPTPTDVANELITNNIQALQTAVAADAGLKAVLANPNSIAAIPALQEAVAKNPDLQKAVAETENLHKAVAQNVDLQAAVAENEDLQDAVAMDANLRIALADNASLQKAVANNASLLTAVAADAGLQKAVAAIPALQEAVAKNPDLQKAVAQNEDLHNTIMSQPSFEIPQDSSEALSWDW